MLALRTLAEQRLRREPRLNDYAPELRGLAQNKYGGHQTQRLRCYPGKFGPASNGRSLSAEEIEALTRKTEKPEVSE